mgnify:FL=1
MQFLTGLHRKFFAIFASKKRHGLVSLFGSENRKGILVPQGFGKCYICCFVTRENRVTFCVEDSIDFTSFYTHRLLILKKIGYGRFVPLYPILIVNVKRIPCEDILLFLYIKPYNGLLFRSFTIYNRKTSGNLKCGNTIKHFSHI